MRKKLPRVLFPDIRMDLVLISGSPLKFHPGVLLSVPPKEQNPFLPLSFIPFLFSSWHLLPSGSCRVKKPLAAFPNQKGGSKRTEIRTFVRGRSESSLRQQRMNTWMEIDMSQHSYQGNQRKVLEIAFKARGRRAQWRAGDVASLIKLPSTKPWIPPPYLVNEMGVRSSDVSRFQGHPWLDRKFEASLSCGTNFPIQWERTAAHHSVNFGLSFTEAILSPA